MKRTALVAVIIFVSLGAIIQVYMPLLGAWLLWAAEWCRTAGITGIVVFGVIYCVSTVLMLPAAILTVAAGSIWGLFWGTVIVQSASVLADAVPFVLARRLGRHQVLLFLQKRGWNGAAMVDEIMRVEGFRLVCLLRLSPAAPYNVMNYLLGLTSVPISVYLVASILGSTPSCLIFVYAGTLLVDATSVDLWGGLILTIVSLIGLTVVSRGAYRRAVNTKPAP